MDLFSYISNVPFNNKFRLFILICLVLWISTFLLDNSLLSRQKISSNSRSFSPYLNETVTINGIKQIVNYQISQYVHLPPDQTEGFQIILYWTKFFDDDIMDQMRKTLNDNAENFLFRPKTCFQQFPNCLITSDRSYLNSSQALIFHWRNFNSKVVPPIRKVNQLWTINNFESPSNSPLLPKSDIKTFNLTATYRRDSDLYIPYGHILKRPVPLHIDLAKTVDISGKIKPIAWFVSHCHTQSRREIYVEKLSKLIQVDIYGRCGKFKCPRSRKCYEKAAKEYLFYLSFENSICKDYVTEKLFNVMKYDIVPIVYGGANYAEILPPGSYIDATKMSPKRLAKLIIQIAGSKKLYLSYFEWRKTHFVSTPGLNEFLFCKLCETLEKQQTNRKTNNGKALENHYKTWNEINQWYFEDACKNPEFQ